MANRIDRIIASDFFPSYQPGQDPAEFMRGVERHVALLKQRGVTHVMVNQGLLSIPLAMEPDNAYYSFCTYGHALDKYVTSSYNEGIYFEGLLAENRKLLLYQAEMARKYGFRCAIRCVEPTFIMESFYKRHPQLRGPRVDNPSCSISPVFALCPMLAEVQDHYSQLMRKMLELVPEIDEMHIFTNDSGGGFCHSTHLYSGPNGPQLCRKTPTGKQAQVFVKTLVDAGRQVNPDFRAVMTSGLSPKEKKDFVEGIPDGAASSVYGAFAWGGGLEDRWGTQQNGPRVFEDPAERQRVRDWQYGDYKARVDQIKENGGIVYASYNSDYYTFDDPRPYETHEVICQLLEWGVTNIIGGGPGGSPYSANTAIIRHAIEHGRVPTEQAVRELAEGWVGAELAPQLLEAWQLNDTTARQYPVPPAGHLLNIWALINHAPIVPDETLLGEHDLDYFLHELKNYDTVMKEQQGGAWRILHYGTEMKLSYIQRFEAVVFPALDKALTILDGVLAKPDLTAAQRECFAEQRGQIAEFRYRMKHHYHWIVASLHRIAGDTAPTNVPSLRDAIQGEIALCEARDRAHGKDPAANPRIRLMKAHLNDPVRKVDLSEFPMSVHEGLEVCDGAHEIEEEVGSKK
ncbi:MAG: hypothetical protein ACYDBB_21945 [Armatimonadota bacterium]